MSAHTSTAAAWPWIPVVAAIVGVTLGYALSRIPAWRDRRRKAAGYLRGINAELKYAVKHARIYVEGENGARVLAPAYRLLTRFSVEGTTWLAAEGFLTQPDIEALLAHNAAAEEFNRCLEEAADVAARERTVDMLEKSNAVDRAGVKARNISTGDPARGTANDAEKAIRAAAARARLKLA